MASSILSGIKGMLFAYKGKDMPERVNQALFELIESTMGGDSSNAFAQGMEYHYDPRDKNEITHATYKGDVKYLWETIRSNAR